MKSAYAKKDKIVSATAGDTSTELQDLLDYNKNGDYNLTVMIPAGTYELTAELRIYSNTTIIADKGAYLMKDHFINTINLDCLILVCFGIIEFLLRRNLVVVWPNYLIT